jgi:membrane fusion protein (multidrug efflux system)
MLRGAFWLGLIAVSGTLAGCTPAKPVKPPPPAVGVVTLKAQPLALSTELPGRTTPFAVAEIRPQVTGIIQKRLFSEGSLVRKGQALYQIDPAPYQAAYARARATLNSMKGRATRAAALAKAGAIAPQANEDAQFALAQAQADADTARINLDYTHIVSPITGRIGASAVTEGALVTAQQTAALATVSALDPIYVDIDQSSAEVLSLRRAAQAGRLKAQADGAAVKLRLDDGSLYPQEGKLQFTEVMVDMGTGALRLRALFPNPDGMLLPGLYVTAIVPQGTDPHSVQAPEHGIRRNDKGDAIAYVVGPDNVAQLRVLKTGRLMGKSWQVQDGLKPGDRMIVDGLMKVRPGMTVKPMPVRDAP